MVLIYIHAKVSLSANEVLLLFAFLARDQGGRHFPSRQKNAPHANVQEQNARLAAGGHEGRLQRPPPVERRVNGLLQLAIGAAQVIVDAGEAEVEEAQRHRLVDVQQTHRVRNHQQIQHHHARVGHVTFQVAEVHDAL